MNPVRVLCASSLLVLATGCADIPRSGVPVSELGSLSCEGLAAERHQNEATRQAASDARGDSWKVVLPVIVAARYGHAVSAQNDAEQREVIVREQMAQKKCAG